MCVCIYVTKSEKSRLPRTQQQESARHTFHHQTIAVHVG